MRRRRDIARRVIAFHLVAAAALHLTCQTAAAETFATRYIAVAQNRLHLVNQNESDCGPASFFNSLLMSQGTFSVAIRALSGRYDWQRYKSFVKDYGSRPSADFADGRPRLGEKGILISDLADMANDLVKGNPGQFAGIRATRKADELGGALTRRVSADWRRSFMQGFAPVVFVGFRASGGAYLDGHALVLLDVFEDQAEISAYDSRSYETFRIHLSEAADSERLRIETAWLQHLRPEGIPPGPTTLDSYLTFERQR